MNYRTFSKNPRTRGKSHHPHHHYMRSARHILCVWLRLSTRVCRSLIPGSSELYWSVGDTTCRTHATREARKHLTRCLKEMKYVRHVRLGMTGVFLSVPRYNWCAPLSHLSSCMLVTHGPLQQSCKEEYKPWNWDATAKYYASCIKTTVPIGKSVPRSSRQLDHMKISWPS